MFIYLSYTIPINKIINISLKIIIMTWKMKHEMFLNVLLTQNYNYMDTKYYEKY